jgi:hypothetical protein
MVPSVASTVPSMTSQARPPPPTWPAPWELPGGGLWPPQQWTPPLQLGMSTWTLPMPWGSLAGGPPTSWGPPLARGPPTPWGPWVPHQQPLALPAQVCVQSRITLFL